jgi:hypothetical protein
MDNVKMSSKNRVVIKNFVDTLLKRFETKYEYNNFLNQEYLYNGVWTTPCLNLLRKLLTCFKETNLISFHIMNCKILSNHELLVSLIPNLAKRQKYLEEFMRPLLVFLGNSKGVSNFENYAPILKTVYESKDDLPASTLKLAVEKIYHVMIQTIRKSSNINNQLPYVYYFSAILQDLNSDEKVAPGGPGLGSTSIEKKQHATIRKNLKSLIMQEILPKVFENGKFLISQVIYEKNIVQRFNDNVFHSEFRNIEYLPMILQYGQIPCTKEIKRKLVPLLIRTSKKWNGTILIQNLIFLHEEQLEVPEIYYNCVDNLFTVFNFYPESQKLTLKENLKINDLKTLLRAILNNLMSFFTKSLDDGNTNYRKNFIPICILAKKLMKANNLSEKYILDLFLILGSDRSNYLQSF